MALSALIQHTGSLSGSPSQAGASIPSLQEILGTTFSATLSASKSGRPTIVGATDGVPFVLGLETITKVRLIVLRVTGGSLKVKLTNSTAGSLQAVMVSNLFMLYAPNAGDEVTAIQLVGTADLEYLIAGDVS